MSDIGDIAKNRYYKYYIINRKHLVIYRNISN